MERPCSSFFFWVKGDVCVASVHTVHPSIAGGSPTPSSSMMTCAAEVVEADNDDDDDEKCGAEMTSNSRKDDRREGRESINRMGM